MKPAFGGTSADYGWMYLIIPNVKIFLFIAFLLGLFWYRCKKYKKGGRGRRGLPRPSLQKEVI
jgi:hypothetical protein